MTKDASPENLRKFLESDDPAMVRMGLSMAKGSGVPEELHLTLLGILLWDSEEGNREAAKDLVDGIGIKNIPESRGWLESLDNLDVDVRRAAVAALGKFGEPAVEPLIRALGDEHEYVRMYVVEALAKIGDERAIEPLIKALGDEELWVRRGAVEALGEIGDARAVEPLIEGLDDDDVSDLFARAAVEIGGTDAVEPLIKRLRGLIQKKDDDDDDSDIKPYNEDYSYRMKTVTAALGRTGAVQAVKPLIEVFWDDYVDVRESAAKALAGIGEPAVPDLVNSLSANDSATRSGVANTLKEIGWEPESDELKALYLLALEDCKGCVELGEPAVVPLVEALEVEPLTAYWDTGDVLVDIRVSAVEALGELGDAWAVEPLIVSLEDENSEVRRGAAEALGKIGDGRAVEPLIELLSYVGGFWGDDKIREAAKIALRKLGHEVE